MAADFRAGPAKDAARILSLLAEPERLRVVAAVVLGYAGIADISRVSGVAERAVARAISRLVAGGLVSPEENGYRFASEELKKTARLMAATQEGSDLEVPADEARVLRAFLKEGRLKAIPTARTKRRVVLEYLAQRFEPGTRYPEKQVNEILAHFSEDTASLRRYLVDEDFLTRQRGYYWRSGGRFQVD